MGAHVIEILVLVMVPGVSVNAEGGALKVVTERVVLDTYRPLLFVEVTISVCRLLGRNPLR
jgi:hypothetical protein